MRCSTHLIEDRYPVSGGRYPDANSVQSRPGRRHAVEEAVDPLAECDDRGNEVWLWLGHPQTNGELELAVQLGQRANGDAEKACELLRGPSPGTFGNVRADRYRGRSHLAGKPEQLGARESSGCLVHVSRQVNALVPHVETTEVMHAHRSNRIRCGGESPRHRLLDTDDRPLETHNRQPTTEDRPFIGHGR